MYTNLAMGSLRLANPIYQTVFRNLPINSYSVHTVTIGNKEEGTEITLPLLNYKLHKNSLNILA